MLIDLSPTNMLHNIDIPKLSWPCDCQIGPAHTSSGHGKGTMSAIDMAPDLSKRWDGEEGWGGDRWNVYAAHSGWVYEDGECGLKIQHRNGYETRYLHITGQISDTDWEWEGNFGGRKKVRRGEVIGSIAMTKDNSNCYDACEDEDCSSGPHLHFELLKNGKPKSLNGVTIGDYKIQKISYTTNYDVGCKEKDDDCVTVFKKGSEKYYPYYYGNEGGSFSFKGGFEMPCNPFTGKCLE